VKGYYRIKIVYVLCIYKQERCVFQSTIYTTSNMLQVIIALVKPTSSSDRQALQNSI